MSMPAVLADRDLYESGSWKREDLLTGQPRPRLRVVHGGSRSPGSELAHWIVNILERLQALAALGPNWDTYGAPPVDRELIPEVLQFLASSWGSGGLPLPAIVPTSTGGFQVEWSSGGLEVEVEWKRIGSDPTVLLCDENTGEEWEGSCLDEKFSLALERLRA